MKRVPVLLLLMLAVTAGLVLITGIVAAETPKAAGHVMAVAGPVVVTKADVTAHPLRFRDLLYWRDVVEARKDGIARILLGGKATVTVRELSSLELREESRPEGARYVAELVSGKIRASVARMLMRPGEQVEVWTFNTVASVRGTDFIVEMAELPAQAGAFGLLGVREVAQLIADRGTSHRETVVVTVSGEVAVSNPLAPGHRVELVGPYQAVRVSGRLDPVLFQVSPGEVEVYLKGLKAPRPQQARSGDTSEAVEKRVEGAALLAASVAGGDGRSHGQGLQGNNGGPSDHRSNSQGSQSGSPSNGNGNGNGNGLGVGLTGGGNGNGNGNGLTPLSQSNSQGNVPPGLAKKNNGGLPPGQAKKLK